MSTTPVRVIAYALLRTSTSARGVVRMFMPRARSSHAVAELSVTAATTDC